MIVTMTNPPFSFLRRIWPFSLLLRFSALSAFYSSNQAPQDATVKTHLPPIRNLPEQKINFPALSDLFSDRIRRFKLLFSVMTRICPCVDLKMPMPSTRTKDIDECKKDTSASLRAAFAFPIVFFASKGMENINIFQLTLDKSG